MTAKTIEPLTLRITSQAENDLAEIWSFIAENALEAASAFVRRIEEKFEPLRRHPELRSRRDNLAPGYSAEWDYAGSGFVGRVSVSVTRRMSSTPRAGR